MAPHLAIVFCGINPGLYSAYVGHHFARPGNRFWAALFAAGFTERLLHPSEDTELLRYGYGLTNLVPRPTASAHELSRAELREGGRRLQEKVLAYRPRFVAVLGISAARVAFDCPGLGHGEQPGVLAGTVLWVLPSPSGLNAHFAPPALAMAFRDLCGASRAVGH